MNTGIPAIDQLDAELHTSIAEHNPRRAEEIRREAYYRHGHALRALVLQYREERDRRIRLEGMERSIRRKAEEERDALLEALKAAQGELGRLLDRAADWDAAAVSALTGVLETQVEDILNAVTAAIANVGGNE